jgi:hypothetical protein
MTCRLKVLATSLAAFGALTSAQSAMADDATYCEALSAKYRELIGTAQIDANAADAMAKCKAGNTAVGIPILEKVLKDNKVTLPPRT